MPNPLDSDIKFLPGIGPKRGAALQKELNIATFRDMLYFFPFRYVDRSNVYEISQIQPTTAYIQLRGKITRMGLIGAAPKSKRLSILLSDPTGNIELVFFKGIKWIMQRLKPDTEYIVFGKITEFNGSYNMVHPEITPLSQERGSGIGGICGVYSSSEKLKGSGLNNRNIIKAEKNIIENYSEYIVETLPEYIIKAKGLFPLKKALMNIHFPQSNMALAMAQTRLKYEELFYLQLSLLRQRNLRMKKENGIVMHTVGEAFNSCYSALSFPLTNAQKRVIREMREDMRSGKQMNRLLQGDVGSGKTLVALLVSLIVIDNGYQCCIMAPTEVLARQHYNSIGKFLTKSPGVKCALLTGTTKKKEREEIHAGLISGDISLLIGTHALIEESVQFKNLALAVVDEQHRFGVEQRSRLWNKSAILPHILVMTATPIPRTLAMTLYGDLDISVIDELPPGRKPVKTIHATERQRKEIFAFMKEQIRKGRQIFVVYPLIKESEKMDYKNLEEGYRIITEEFRAPQYVTAVVHGQQKSENKLYDMKLFAEGRANILVATSVIEVGVDVPNATVMIIESAERFGLSQLHQLRGRVGRGENDSYCILMTGYRLSKESRERIELMCSTQDGFELAEADLRMRGPGDLEGTIQSGLAIDLHIANPAKDSRLLEDARRCAKAILDEDPLLERSENRVLLQQLRLLKHEGKEATDYSQIS